MLTVMRGMALVLFGLMTLVRGVQAEQISYAGVALASYGDSQQDVIDAYPAASRLIFCGSQQVATTLTCDDVPNNFTQIVLEKLSSAFVNSDSELELSLELVDPRTSSGFILVPLITRESVVSAVEGSDYTYSFRIFADVMLIKFAPGDVQFVSSAPYILNLFDVQNQPYTDEQILDVFVDLYTNDSQGVNFFNELAIEAANSLQLGGEDPSYMQVSRVTVSDEVSIILEQSYPEDVWRQQIAQFLSANIVQQSQQTLLPPVASPDMLDRLRIVFSDVNRKLVMPPANYNLALDVERFVRHEETSGDELIICFIVAARLLAMDGFGDEVSNIRFVRLKNSCGATDPDTAREDKMYFPESLLSLLTGLATQFDRSVERDFVSNHVKESEAAIDELLVLNEILHGNEGNVQ
jgi:hypothetical protein